MAFLIISAAKQTDSRLINAISDSSTIEKSFLVVKWCEINCPGAGAKALTKLIRYRSSFRNSQSTHQPH